MPLTKEQRVRMELKRAEALAKLKNRRVMLSTGAAPQTSQSNATTNPFIRAPSSFSNTSNAFSPVSSSANKPVSRLTEEQKRRMENNRVAALARKLKSQTQVPKSTNTNETNGNLNPSKSTTPNVINTRSLYKLSNKGKRGKKGNGRKRAKRQPVKTKFKKQVDAGKTFYGLEGLSNPLDYSNKGYTMLVKMGYQPGDSLGKDNKGRLEPIDIRGVRPYFNGCEQGDNQVSLINKFAPLKTQQNQGGILPLMATVLPVIPNLMTCPVPMSGSPKLQSPPPRPLLPSYINKVGPGDNPYGGEYADPFAGYGGYGGYGGRYADPYHRPYGGFGGYGYRAGWGKSEDLGWGGGNTACGGEPFGLRGHGRRARPY